MFWSSDAVALYGSLQSARSAEIARQLLQQSGLEVTGVDWQEAALYLALTLPRYDPRTPGRRAELHSDSDFGG